MERSSIEGALRRLDDENKDLQRNLTTLQSHAQQLEQNHAQRLLEVTSQHKSELDMQGQRLREAQTQSDKAIAARERIHRQRIAGLEEQINQLKSQLGDEQRRRNDYVSGGAGVLFGYTPQSFSPNADLRSKLSGSLSTIGRDASPAKLRFETDKLGQTPSSPSPRRFMTPRPAFLRSGSPPTRLRSSLASART